jgi:hypothetical protein
VATLSADNFSDAISVFYKPVYELFKQMQDYLKVLITLNSATILIIMMLLEKIFRYPKATPLLFISFCCFAASLIASLIVMISLTKFYALLFDISSDLTKIWSSISADFTVQEKTKKELLAKANKVSTGKLNWYSIGNYSYLSGIVLLVLFMGINLFCK